MKLEKSMGTPISVQICDIETETSTTKTLIFDLEDNRDAEPGQFLMVWVPNIDEIPMSISLWEYPTVGITVQAIGDATTALTNLQQNDWIGIRGPFGNHFSLDSSKALVVGGGIGIAPLRPLTKALLEQGTEVTMVIAAKSSKDLVPYEFPKLKAENLTLCFATDDGTEGFKGFATGLVEELLIESSYDKIYTCGPELMMSKLYHIASEKNIPIEVSIERHMKCGCGICGTCALDPNGELVCMDGPIFSGVQLEKIEEFGQYHRDATGVKKYF
jgi:dihydroorotate dehydrogenase electron transfer subunit